MPKLLIPFYAIDIQPFTCTLNNTTLSDATFSIGKALSTDTREYAEVNNAGGYVEIQYTSLATLTSYINGRFGTGWFPAFYVRITNDAYIFDNEDEGNYVYIMFNDPIETGENLTVYGDATVGEIPGGAGTNDAAFIDSANPKITYSGDGEFVVHCDDATLTAARRLHFDSDVGYAYRDTNYRLQCLIDGLLIDLPPFHEDRNWSEQFPGGVISRNPVGKLNYTGFKNQHMRRGRRSITVLFNEISTAERDKLYYAFITGKGFIPMLLMPDEDNNGTWMYCKLSAFTEREPEAGIHFVECTFEEY